MYGYMSSDNTKPGNLSATTKFSKLGHVVYLCSLIPALVRSGGFGTWHVRRQCRSLKIWKCQRWLHKQPKLLTCVTASVKNGSTDFFSHIIPNLSLRTPVFCVNLLYLPSQCDISLKISDVFPPGVTAGIMYNYLFTLLRILSKWLMVKSLWTLEQNTLISEPSLNCCHEVGSTHLYKMSVL